MGARTLSGFVPFACFALLDAAFGVSAGLVAGLIASLLLIAWELFRHRRIAMLELGSAIIFGALAFLAPRRQIAWSMWEVRCYVDAGLALVILLGIAARRPFTLQHGRSVVSPAVAASTAFQRRHLVLSGAWAAAFVGLAVVDGYMAMHPATPDRRGILLSIAILLAAGKFTQRSIKQVSQSA